LPGAACGGIKQNVKHPLPKEKKTMKIAITAQGQSSQSIVDPRFGRAAWLLIHDDSNNSWESIDNIAGRDSAHGAGIQAAQKVADHGVEALITGAIGPKAFTSLTAGRIRIYHGATGTAQEALAAFKAGKLKEASEQDATGGV
jgi:predicted Fe-Mo cluster-binding NifX family protein